MKKSKASDPKTDRRLFRLKSGGGELDDQVHIVGLHLGFVGGFVSYLSAAFVATVVNDVAAARVGIDVIGAKNAAAGIGAVTRENIHVQRAEAKGTMVA